MFKEILDVLQDDPFGKRRWFHDDYFDLFVRHARGELVAFELCYGIDSNERALVWRRGQGYFHDGAASREFIGARLASGDPLKADPIIARFERASGGLPGTLRLELEAHLGEYALQNAEGSARRSRFRRAAWQRSGGEAKEDRSRIP
jgi:hypothetical protein